VRHGREGDGDDAEELSRPRGVRPAATTAAVTRPYIRAASAPDGTGSKSLSARCAASVRRARSSCSSCRSCSLSGRTWCGPADSSARVIALIAISSGSPAGSTRRRRTTMLVSGRPCRGSPGARCGASPLAGIAVLVVSGRVLVGTECVQTASGRVAGHRREFLPGDKPALAPDGDQLPGRPALPVRALRKTSYGRRSPRTAGPSGP